MLIDVLSSLKAVLRMLIDVLRIQNGKVDLTAGD